MLRATRSRKGGGDYVIQPTILFHWLKYAALARDTGATVVVPIYPVAPQGTAGTVVPQMADIISSEIDQHGAENVSVYARLFRRRDRAFRRAGVGASR